MISYLLCRAIGTDDCAQDLFLVGEFVWGKLRLGHTLLTEGFSIITLTLALTWFSLVMARAGREFSNWLAAGPPELDVLSEP